MTKKEFRLFIEILGFKNTWESIDDKYHMETDIVSPTNQNGMAFIDQLKIEIVDDMIHLSLSQINQISNRGKNFGNFNLSTFGDKNDLQLEIFLSFILGSFNNKPNHIVQLMRDMKIENILK